MKKLLQINPVVRENTSTGKIMRELGDMAIKAGWESYIAYSKARDGVPDHSSRLIPIGDKIDLFLHWLASRLFDAHGLASRRATKRFIKQVQTINPDIIHIHNVHGYFLNYKLLFEYLAERGKPVIWTTHDCWLYTGHCYHYSAAGCDKWKTGCGNCPQKNAFPTSWWLDRSHRNWLDKKDSFTAPKGIRFVCVSDWMQQEMRQSFLKDCPTSVIHNGIDLQVFKPMERPDVLKRYGLEGKSFVLGLASIWLQEKGLDDLIQLADRLKSDELLVLVGRMTPEQERSLPKKVIHIGRTTDAQELAALYSAAIVLVNPTWQDNYPTVNLEAIACGTPVITYRTGGSIESITPETGFIVEQGDIAGVSSCLEAIRQRGKAAYSSACRAYALAHFDKHDRFNDYIQLYENLTTR